MLDPVSQEQLNDEKKIRDAIPGGRYTCAGCGKSYAAPRDAMACCGNRPDVFSPRSAPLEVYQDHEDDPEEDEGREAADADQDAKAKR